MNLSEDILKNNFSWEKVASEIGKYTSDGIVIFDSDGKIYSWNISFEIISGLTKDEIHNKDVRSLFSFLEAQGEKFFDKVFEGQMVEIPASSYYFNNRKGRIKGMAVPLIHDDKIQSGLLLISELKGFEFLETKIFEQDALVPEVENLAKIGSWEADLVTGYAYWSEQMYEIFELDPSLHIRHKEFMNYLHPEDVARVQEVIEQVRVKKITMDFEYRIITISGSFKHIFGRVKPVEDELGNVVKLIGYSQDITENKYNKALLSEIIHCSMEGIAVVKALRDESNNVIDFKIVFINKFAEEFFQIPSDELKGKRLLGDYGEMVRNEYFELLKNTIQTGKPVNLEKLFSENGHSKWIRFSVVKMEDQCLITFQDFTDFKRNLEEIKKNQAFLYSSQEAGGVGAFELELTTQTFKYTPQFKTIMGLSSETETFQDFLNLIDLADRAKVKNCIETMIEILSPCDTEFKFYDSAGSERFGWLKVSPFEIEEYSRLIGSVVDITQRKLSEMAMAALNSKLSSTTSELQFLNEKLEEKIRQRTHELIVSNERFRFISKAADDAIYDWYFSTNEIWFNDAFLNNFGFKEVHIVSGYEFWKSRLHPNDRKRVVEGLEKSVEEGKESWRDEYRFLKADGNYAFIMDRGFIIRDVKNQPERMVGAMIQLSDIKLLEEKLRDSEENYRFLAESMPVLIWITDEQGNSLYANRKLAEYTGMEYDDYKNYGWIRAIHSDDLERVEKAWKHSVITGKAYSLEYRVRNANGNYRWFLSRAVPRKDKAGKIIKWVGTSTDIHNHMVLSENLLRIKAELDETVLKLKEKNLHLDRINKELDNFVYSASHDLRSPVRNIQSMIALIDSELSTNCKDDKMVYYFKLLSQSVENLKKTIHDLTEITQSVDFEEMQEGSTCNEILEDLKISLRDIIESSHATIESSFEVNEVKLSRKNLRSILYNLLTNALKFRSKDRPVIISISTIRKDSFVVLKVSDNGIGIRKEDIDKVFAPFKRIHHDVEGTGMGIPIIKRIIENNGGSIEVDSEEGKGTTFTIFIKD